MKFSLDYLHDPALPLRSKGFLTYLLKRKSEGISPTFQEIRSEFFLSDLIIRTMFRDLVLLGYARLVKTGEKGHRGIKGSHYEVADSPIWKTPVKERYKVDL